MREIMKLGAKLLIISLVAGLALGITNAVTQGPIEQQRIAEANAARQKVLADAVEFEAVDAVPEGIDELHRGMDAAGNLVGATGKITVTGYGGPIEVTVGISLDGIITGVNVGGSDFAETAGLGAKTKDAAFTDRYLGLDAKNDPTSIAVKQDGGSVDAVSSATISSRAVSGGVQAVCKALQSLLTEGN